VLKEVREGKAPPSQKATNVSRSALDILHTSRNLSPIITFCGEMDGMLGCAPTHKLARGDVVHHSVGALALLPRVDRLGANLTPPQVFAGRRE